MDHFTAQKFGAMQQDMAQTYRVDSASETFSVAPTQEQTLQKKIVESSELLQRINVRGVKKVAGQKVMLGSSKMITGRTNTKNNEERQPQNAAASEGQTYLLSQTNSDTYIDYETIDEWAHQDNFQELIQENVNEQKALNRIAIGWNGIECAPTTNPTLNPLGQDVNKGWLQEVRDKAPAQVLTEGKVTVGKIKLGAGGDFETLDAAAADLKKGIPAHKSGKGDLIVIVGSDLLAWDEGKLYANHGATPTEKLGIQMATESYGGLPAVSNVPFFPANGLLITSWKNLSIYWLLGSNRRALRDKPEFDRIEDFHSRKEGYVVEDLEKIIFWEADNVEYL